jgi:hypothetical protein
VGPKEPRLILITFGWFARADEDRFARVESNESPSRAAFDPVPLPAGEPGAYSPAALDEALRGWVTSEPLRALADASGWDWPHEADTLALLDKLAGLSADWDFRQNRERNFIEGAPAQVRGREIPQELAIGAARALGLVDAVAVTGRKFSHVIVLSGLVTACVNRTHRASELLRGGLAAEAVVVLGAHRPLGGQEPQQARDGGLGDLSDEAEVIVAATRKAFELGPPSATQESGPRPDPGQPSAFHRACARYQWPSVEVVIAPSSEPETRRANTADQLRYWAKMAGAGREHDVLILTTQIYVPYQHMETVRVLGLERGCGVYSCGVDAASSLLPRATPFAGRDYLQEIRSALRAAPGLLRAARDAASRA